MKKLSDVLGDFQPKTALVLGSGLGGVTEAVDAIVRIPYSELEGFPESKVSGHGTELVAGTIGQEKVVVLSGRVHYYEDGNPAAMRGALEALKDAGIERIILTNSAGSLREEAGPGHVMQIVDHINFSGTNPLIGEPSDDRFVGLTNAYDEGLAERFKKAADDLEIMLHRGVYMWFSGPTFETPAEIKMAGILGADAVGMSTVPEVILARFLGMDVAAFSVITNYAAGMTGLELGHGETKEMAPKGGAVLTRLLRHVFDQGLDA